MNTELETVQEACDYAVLRLVEQGGRCLSAEGACLYGDGAGRHCSIGWLLDHSDEALMQSQAGLRQLLQNNSEKVPKILIDNFDCFSALQALHDHSTRDARFQAIRRLRVFISTTAPQYNNWVEMGEADAKY